jgi:hypothetical protein
LGVALGVVSQRKACRSREALLPRLVVATPEDLQSYVVVVLGVLDGGTRYVPRSLGIWIDVPGRKSIRRGKNLTPALLRARGSSRVHKVLATRTCGPPPHANQFSTCVTWKDSPGDTGTFL